MRFSNLNSREFRIGSHREKREKPSRIKEIRAFLRLRRANEQTPHCGNVCGNHFPYSGPTREDSTGEVALTAFSMCNYCVFIEL
jgi:hypothetical protein